MRYMLLWITLLVNLRCASFTEKSYVYNFHHSSPVFYFCDVKDDENTDFHCYGNLTRIPADLSDNLRKLSVTDADIEHFKKSFLDPYRATLTDITLHNLHFLRVIEDGAFADMPNLNTIYISHAPQLKFVNGLLEGVTTRKFYSLRIVWTSLIEIPDLSHISQENTMFLLDLDHNKIERLQSNSIKISVQQLTMNFNQITVVEDYAFNDSEIAELYMRSNFGLNELGEYAFTGVRSLRLLDLSESAIKTLPIEGLQDMEVLKIEGTPSMQTIPSIYEFQNLKEAKLTHSFHCCAFKYPEQHNPKRHAEFEDNMKKTCELFKKSQEKILRRRRAVQIHSPFESYPRYIPYNRSAKRISSSHYDLSSEESKESVTPLRGRTITHEAGKSLENSVDEDLGFFHKATKVDNTVDFQCGKFIFKAQVVECQPEPNALNPCEDIMGMSWLRISVWCVVKLALFGNLAVLFVVVFSDSEITVSRFLICNLAIADLCMGLYLLLIASMDYHSVGQYFNFAYNWQYGVGCQIAGFLTVFASHLSIYTLTVITLERWFAITYAIHLTKRITRKYAVYILMGGWIYSMVIAALPVFRISSYSSTSICLPMESTKIADKLYLYTIIFLNGFAFAIIVFCYVQIYLSLGYETRRANTKGEMTIAKKMSLLILVDFATVAPVAFFGLTALAGYPLIGVPRSKILLVFFYPLNACANPYLYALMTSQYRKDLVILISKCGICTKKAKQHKLSDAFPLTNSYGQQRTLSYSNGQSGATAVDSKSSNTFV